MNVVHDRPRAAVVIIAYNDEMHIERAIQSVCNQTERNIEIICVDDGSTDATCERMSLCAQRDARIRVITQPNSGALGARYAGLRQVTSDFVLFLDSDDVFVPEAVETACGAADETGADLLEFGVSLIKDENNPPSQETWAYLERNFSQKQPLPETDHGPELVNACFDRQAITWNIVDKLYRTELLRKAFRFYQGEWICMEEDMLLTLMVLCQAERYVRIPAKLYAYTVGGGVSTTAEKVTDTGVIQKLATGGLTLKLAWEWLNKLGCAPDEAMSGMEALTTAIRGNMVHQMLNHVAAEKRGEYLKLLSQHFESNEYFELISDAISQQQGHIEHLEGNRRRLEEQNRELQEQNRYYKESFDIISNAFRATLETLENGYRSQRHIKVEDVVDDQPKAQEADQEADTVFYSVGKPMTVLCTKHTQFVAKLVAHALEKAGIPAHILTEEPEAYSDELHIVICPQMFHRMPDRYIAFQMELTVSARWLNEEYFDRLNHACAVLDYSTVNVSYFKKMTSFGGKFYYLPIDYLPSLKRREDRYKYDVLFYGDTNNPRRQRILAELQKRFSVKVVSEVFGEELYQLLGRARVVVNIHYYDNAMLETTRLYEVLSLGRSVVVSERSSNPEEEKRLERIVDFVEVNDTDALTTRVEYWLSHKAERAEAVEKNNRTLSRRSNAFDFFFYRFLLAQDWISFDHFYELAGNFVTFTGNRICLSLPETGERRQAFDRDNRYGFEVIPGLRHYRGWTGCGLSYKYIMKRAKDQGLEEILVCEDDVQFPDDFETRWENCLKYLREYKDYDIFQGFMADVGNVNIRKVDRMYGETFVHLDHMISTVFNYYRSCVYDSLINWNETNPNMERNTIDRALEAMELKIVTTVPFLVDHKEDLDSAVWDFNNSHYRDQIDKSKKKLENLIRKYTDPIIPQKQIELLKEKRGEYLDLLSQNCEINEYFDLISEAISRQQGHIQQLEAQNGTRQDQPPIYAANLYFDNGEGYKQENSVSIAYDASKFVDFTTSIRDGTTAVRLDMVEGCFCIIKNLEIISDHGALPYRNINGFEMGRLEVFCTTDPQIEICLSPGITWLRIQADVFVISDTRLFSEMQSVVHTEKQKFDNLRGALAQTEVEHDDLRDQLQKITAQAEELRVQLLNVSNSFEIISNSTCWKITKPVRVVLDTAKAMLCKEKEYAGLVKKAVVIMRVQGIKAVLEKYRQRKIRLSSGYIQTQTPQSYMVGNNSFVDRVGDKSEPLIPKEWIDIQRNKPLISIVIAAKRLSERTPYLKKALESLCAQSYQHMEVIIAADSTDIPYVQEVICSLTDRLTLKTVMIDLQVQDQWTYWSEGVSAATGSLIGFLEQEDTLTPNCLAYVLEAYNESIIRNWELYLIPDVCKSDDNETLYKDWMVGAGWQCGGVQGLLHFGVFEKAHYQPDRAAFEQWLLSLKRDQIFVSPWIGCYGVAVEDVWQSSQVRCIPFYLPQFHAIPENDKWWGEGFTEWVNVKKAKPLYRGHHQPRIPGDLGYYDLAGEEGAKIQRKQIAMAKEYGLSGFCYYYYWFDGGKRLLEMPLDRHLHDQTMDFPFCLCWANENWTRNWDGLKNEVLMPQTYQPGWAENFILDLLPYLKDERYIRVNGAPFLLIYNLQDIPKPSIAINTWRTIARQSGIDRLHISAVRRTMDASEMEMSGYTLDSLTDFPPHLLGLINIDHDEYSRFGLAHGQVKDYRKACAFYAEMSKQDYTYFRTAMLEWDNTARRGKRAFIFEEFSIKEYKKWLYAAKRYVLRQNRPGEDLMFINAWNEWAEGTYLEPSEPLGNAALEATREVLERR